MSSQAGELTRQVSASPKVTDDIGNLSIGGDSDDDDSPRLVYTSPKSLVYRQCRDVMGNKIILNPSASDIQQHKLDIEHEQLIFNHLPSSFHKRNVTKVEEIEGGNLSIHFEWIEGMTLEDLLQQETGLLGHQSNTTSVLKTRLAVAIGISKTLLDCHDSGVAYNNLSPSNIILEKTGNDTFEVSFINFSKSIIIFRELDESAKMVANQKDLLGLGHIFQMLFGARQGLFDSAQALKDDTDEHMNMDVDDERKKKTKISTEHEGNEGLPLYLVALIAGLLKNKEMGNNAQNSEERYVNVKDVLDDLKAGVDKFDVFFRPFDWKEASSMNQLPVLPG